MDKLIRVIDEDTSKLDEYLKKGWYINNISACRSDMMSVESICYIAIRK